MNRLVYVLNGPNLNLLGKRQPHIYGHETLADVEADCRKVASEHGLELRFHQSNREYEIIDWIHEAREVASGIVINPAAFTHTSVAILDALNTFEATVIEVHISNVHKREEFRHHSYVSLRADGVIAGGVDGTDFAQYKAANFAANRKGYFHYVLLPHRYGTNSTSSGRLSLVRSLLASPHGVATGCRRRYRLSLIGTSLDILTPHIPAC